MLLKRRLLSVVGGPLSVVVVVIGCSDTSREGGGATTRTSDAALREPFGNWSNVDTDISGGNTGELNKGALKRDVDRVLMR